MSTQGFNFFTDLKEECEKSENEIEEFVRGYVAIDSERAYWGTCNNKNRYYSIKCLKPMSSKNRSSILDKRNWPNHLENIKPCFNSYQTPQKRLGDEDSHGYCTPAKKFANEKLSHAKDLNIRILNALRNFGLDEKMSKFSDRFKAPLQWNHFAVILVLPREKYDQLCKDENLVTLSKELLENYAKFAVPSSYTPELDHPLEEGRVVFHAEPKLMGDPLRYPAKLSIPYDRSLLMRTITDHEIGQWEQGINATTKYKLFLYSENKICDHCEKAIYRSIFVNLVKTGRIDNNITPVIGHQFANISDENELIKETEKNHNVIFMSPKYASLNETPLKSGATGDSIVSDVKSGPDGVKSNLKFNE